MRRSGAIAIGLCAGLWAGAAAAQEIVVGAEDNRLRRYDADTIDTRPLAEDVLIPSASDSPAGRDVNGMICPIPDGSGRFVMGEDTGQPTPPAGWGVFDAAGNQVGKLTATYRVAGAEPYGCAFDASGRLWTTDVGNQGFGAGLGQLTLWFPDPVDGYATFPGPPGAYPGTNADSGSFCKIATNLSTAGAPAIDAQGRVYVPQAGGFQVTRFLPPYPTGLGPGEGCEGTDPTGAPAADNVARELFAVGPDTTQLFTPTGIAIAPNGNIYVSSVASGEIVEYDDDGNFVRWILRPAQAQPLTYPVPTGTPQGIAVGGDGTVYYADINLVGVLPNLGPGANGSIRRIRFDAAGDPLAPELVRDGLRFPDAVAVQTGDLEQSQWRSYGGGPRRLFFNQDEDELTPDNAPNLTVRWRAPTNAIITGQPVVAAVDLPGEGITQVVYFQSWDQNVYAVRMRDGTELWRFTTLLQPGATFPQAGSAHVERRGNEDLVLIAAGEEVYALEAVTGQERWRFTAGTGCVDGSGQPPGDCGFSGERNEIETSPIVAGEDTVVFGMDVNEGLTGKGGVYGLDLDTGAMKWFFDLSSGSLDAGGNLIGAKVCRPLPGDDVRRFDGYHSEAELGLPAGFLASRPGCDFDRTPSGCQGVWSSPAVDEARGLLFFGSTNCETSTVPGDGLPPPPMPFFDESIVALAFDGTPAWRWRPREIDNADLAYGATPNLFTIDLGAGLQRDVVGIGNKDGTYTVIDRDGVNALTGVAWNDTDPSALPYWSTQVVPGGAVGGNVGGAAVDEVNRRVLFNTAPGTSANVPPFGTPQQPTVHALDLDTGAIAWQNTAESNGNADASFGPASGFPGMVFIGSTFPAILRGYDTRADLGARIVLLVRTDSASIASAPAIVDGNVIAGSGVGARGSGQADTASRSPIDLIAWCVPGLPGCELPACKDGADNDGDGQIDAANDLGCVDALDRSEVGGDLDFDGDLDGSDQRLFAAAFGTLRGEAGWAEFADFDRDKDIDEEDSRAFNALIRALGPPEFPCGIGPELAPVLAGLAAWRSMRGRRRARQSRDA